MLSRPGRTHVGKPESSSKQRLINIPSIVNRPYPSAKVHVSRGKANGTMHTSFEGENEGMIPQPSSVSNGVLQDSTPSSNPVLTSSNLKKEQIIGQKVTKEGVSATPAIPFWSIAAIVTLIFLCHGWIAEMLVLAVVSNGFSLGWFFAFLTVLGQWIPTIPRKGWNKSEFRIEHIIVGVAHCLSMGMSNSGGMLVEYNTFALFKSSKVVFVMLTSWATLGSRPSSRELLWGIALVAGLIMLTGADESASANSRRITHPISGAILLFSGISGNALVSVGQQAALQRRVLQRNPNFKFGTGMLQCPFTWGPQNSLPPPPGQTQPTKEDEREALLFYSNIISIIMLGGVCFLNGELQQGIRFFTDVATPKLWLGQVSAMTLVATGQRLVLTLNGAYGATASAAVLTFRKAASFLTSVIMFPKPFNPLHAIGLFIVVTSAVMIQRAESTTANQKKIKTEADTFEKVQDSV